MLWYELLHENECAVSAENSVGLGAGTEETTQAIVIILEETSQTDQRMQFFTLYLDNYKEMTNTFSFIPPGLQHL